MNVKPGDIARVIAPSLNAGATVSVLRPAGMAYEDANVDWEVVCLSPVLGQTLDGEEVPLSPGQMCGVPDKHLRRIDPDGEDESLSWSSPRELEPA